MLKALLVAGCGRSGTTAFMSLLATAPRVAFDRIYPFEQRYLTYLAKLALLLERQDPAARVTSKQLYDFADITFGSYPRDAPHLTGNATGALGSNAVQWLHSLWQTFGTQVASTAPEATFYAEKAPSWLPPLARECFPAHTIYLFRDPRDIYLSANAFMQKRGSPGFDRLPTDTDLDYARTLAHRFLSYFENYLMDRNRPDCLLVKYEEMILGKDDLPARLEHYFAIEPHWEDSPWLEAHGTTSGLPLSVARWQREPLPPEVDGFLQTCLRAAMEHLGYPVTGARPSGLPPAFEFRSGALDLNRVPCSSDGQLLPQVDASAALITGPDFWMSLPLPAFEAAAVREIWVCLKGDAGNSCSVYWRASGNEFSEDCSVHLPYRGGLHWQVLRIPVAGHPQWKGAIGGLRLDPFNGCAYPAHAPCTGFLRWLRLVE